MNKFAETVFDIDLDILGNLGTAYDRIVSEYLGQHQPKYQRIKSFVDNKMQVEELVPLARLNLTQRLAREREYLVEAENDIPPQYFVEELGIDGMQRYVGLVQEKIEYLEGLLNETNEGLAGRLVSSMDTFKELIKQYERICTHWGIPY